MELAKPPTDQLRFPFLNKYPLINQLVIVGQLISIGIYYSYSFNSYATSAVCPFIV